MAAVDCLPGIISQPVWRRGIIKANNNSLDVQIIRLLRLTSRLSLLHFGRRCFWCLNFLSVKMKMCTGTVTKYIYCYWKSLKDRFTCFQVCLKTILMPICSLKALVFLLFITSCKEIAFFFKVI